jgi:tRNA threonylcarbamoyladenosine biosynthesis protein TsaE
MHGANNITLTLDGEAATLACGARFSHILTPGVVVQLHGDLGAGKTTFVRGVLHGLGHHGKVKSPTYTLVEPYVVAQFNMYHFDLYRFTSEDEWDAAGFREYFNAQSVCMIEWPEKAEHVLPAPDIHVQLIAIDLDQGIGRKITFSAGSLLGSQCLKTF